MAIRNHLVLFISLLIAPMAAKHGAHSRLNTRKLYAATVVMQAARLPQVEPLGPKKMADIMVVAPCTGTTLAKLDLGISDTPVTLGVKSMLRGGRPILLAPSTNDGLGATARHLAELLNRKHYFLVPLGQDAPYPKPSSLQSCFEMIPDGVAAALRGNQLQPVLLT